MYVLLAGVALYMFAMNYSVKAKRVEATEKRLNYTEEGGASLRGSVPEVAISPARDMHGEDTSTPFATHPDDVIRVHQALQNAHTAAQLSDLDLQILQVGM